MSKDEALKAARDALNHIKHWNNADIRGFDDIAPNMEMLKARRRLIRAALKEIDAR